MTALTITNDGKGEPRVDSRIVAEHLGNQHKNVIELIERYPEQFERFGIVPFQTEKLPGTGKGRSTRFALLNEDQAFFLLSLSRNTEKVVGLKATLVQAFREARQGQTTGAIEYLPGYHELHDLAHQLANGSANERFVHMNLNKLVNKTVGIASGQRSTLPAPVKSLTVVAQIVASRAMTGAKDHHDGYQKAKTALGTLERALIGGTN